MMVFSETDVPIDTIKQKDFYTTPKLMHCKYGYYVIGGNLRIRRVFSKKKTFFQLAGTQVNVKYI